MQYARLGNIGLITTKGIETLRLPILLASLLLLCACTKTDSDAARVFENAFSLSTPPHGVVALNGYRWSDADTSPRVT